MSHSDSVVQFPVTIQVDLSPFLKTFRYAKKNQAKLAEVAAERFRRWLRGRFIAMSAGAGTPGTGGTQWPALETETVLRKIRRKVATNPYWILREYNHLLRNIETQRAVDGMYVGYVRDEEHESKRSEKTVIWLVEHHAETGRNAITEPNRATRKKMAADVKKEFDKIKRRFRRKGK